MNIESAQYTRNIDDTANENIKATIDGTEVFVPLDPDNRHYTEILKQVKAGTLTIQEAD